MPRGKISKQKADTITVEVSDSGDLQQRLDRLSEQTGLSNSNLLQKWILQEESLVGIMSRGKPDAQTAVPPARKRSAVQAASKTSKTPEKAEARKPQDDAFRDELIKRILKLRKDGASLKKIVDTLNDEEVPTVSGVGKWYTSSVTWLLRAHKPY